MNKSPQSDTGISEKTQVQANIAPAENSHDKTGILGRSWALFYVFASISAVALGGGLVMLPVMQKEFVAKRKWLTDEDMLDTVALMQSLPGIIAVNMSSLIGYRVAGIPGVLAATFGVVLPPFLTIVAIAYFLFNFCDLEAVQHVFTGIRAAVCAMILVSVIKMGKKTLTGAFEITIAALGFIILLFFKVNIILLIVLAAIAGLVFSLITKKRADKLNETKEERP